jgi:hypothetical protein
LVQGGIGVRDAEMMGHWLLLLLLLGVLIVFAAEIAKN